MKISLYYSIFRSIVFSCVVFVNGSGQKTVTLTALCQQKIFIYLETSHWMKNISSLIYQLQPNKFLCWTQLAYLFMKLKLKMKEYYKSDICPWKAS